MSKWGPGELTALSEKLKLTGYGGLEFDPRSAPLVASLLRDVIKGARYGKTAQRMLDQKNETVEQLQAELEAAKGNNTTTTKCTNCRQAGNEFNKCNDCQQRNAQNFRLCRLAGLCVDLLLRSATGAPLPSSSCTLLNLLVSMEGQEFDSVAIHERWSVAENCELAVLKQEPGAAVASLEQQLLDSVGRLHKALDSESELRKLEKKFASHLKKCTFSGRARSASPAASKRARSDTEEVESEENLRSRASKLQGQLKFKNDNILELSKEIASLRVELHEANRRCSTLVLSNEAYEEETGALQKRIELFETEFRELEQKIVQDAAEIRRLEIDADALHDQNEKLKNVEAQLQETSLRLLESDRALAEAQEKVQQASLEQERCLAGRHLLEEKLQRQEGECRTSQEHIRSLTESWREAREEVHRTQLKLERCQGELAAVQSSNKSLAERYAQVKELLETHSRSEIRALDSKEEVIREKESFRGRIRSLENQLEIAVEELEGMRQRNAFLLSQIANDLNFPVAELLSEQLTGEGDNKRLLFENHVVREKCEATLRVLRSTLEINKRLQTQLADLTQKVTRLELELEEARDELELHDQMTSAPPSSLAPRRRELESKSWHSVSAAPPASVNEPSTSRFGTTDEEGGPASDFSTTTTSARVFSPFEVNTLGPTPLPVSRARSSTQLLRDSGFSFRRSLSPRLSTSFRERARAQILSQSKESEALDLMLSRLSAGEKGEESAEDADRGEEDSSEMLLKSGCYSEFLERHQEELESDTPQHLSFNGSTLTLSQTGGRRTTELLTTSRDKEISAWEFSDNGM